MVNQSSYPSHSSPVSSIIKCMETDVSPLMNTRMFN
jgi:hypothetical protein